LGASDESRKLQVNKLSTALIVLASALCGCAKDSELQPPYVADVYAPVATNSSGDNCAAMAAEIDTLSSGLGGPPTDSMPPIPATAGARWADYGKDVTVQTLIGPLQPIIQTVKASINYDDENRLETENRNRAQSRRAYLLGAMDGANCPTTG